MKRLFAILLSVALLLTLAGCGRRVEAAPSGQTAAAEPEPQSWTELSAIGEGYGYITARSETTGWEALPENCIEEAGSYYTQEGLTLTRYSQSGQFLCTVTLESLLPEDAGEAVHEDLFSLRFGAEDLWLIHIVYTVLNEQTGETREDCCLEHWSQAGTMLLRLPLDETFGVAEDDTVTLLELSPEGLPLVGTIHTLYFLNEDGSVRASADTGGVQFMSCRDRDGQVYLRDLSQDTLCTIDWAGGQLGQALFSLGPLDKVRPGSGPYGFFLIDDVRLRGVDLEARTITLLLNWEDCGLGGIVQDVAWVDGDTIRASSYSFLSDQPRYLDVTRVPADQVPEKTAIRFAIPVSEGRATRGMDWTSVLDTMLLDAITSFNLEHSEVEIVGVPYASAQELQLMMTSEPPDLIYWTDSEAEGSPAFQNYARRGYLTDLEPRIDADPELDLSDFYPNVIGAAKDMGGGLYALPLQFYLRTLSAPAAYVGTNMGWTCSDLRAAAEQMPEGMVLWEGLDQVSALSHLLEVNLSRFANLARGTCDFESQGFYDLLTLCRDCFPAEGGAQGESLLDTEVTIGTMGNFAEDTLQRLKDQGRTLIGYPDARGNGCNMVFGSLISICALGEQQEVAWEFYRTLLGFQYQRASAGLQLSIRVDAQEDKEDWLLEVRPGLTREESLAARDLISGAQSVTVFDSPITPIVLEEAAAFFQGDKTAAETARVIQSRVEIYLGEQG